MDLGWLEEIIVVTSVVGLVQTALEVSLFGVVMTGGLAIEETGILWAY